MIKRNGPAAVFFDRDGVLIVDKGFQIDSKEIEYFPDTITALRLLDDVFLKIVVSNQSGVGRSLFTSDDVVRFNDCLSESLAARGIVIDGWYFCPHLPEDNCECRKPRPGMIKQAFDKFEMNLKKSWIIGDKSSDIELGSAVGINTVLVNTGYAGKERGHSDIAPDHITANLSEAIKLINRSVS